MYTTYKISSYIRSKLIKGGTKFTNLAPAHSFGDILSSALPYPIAGLRRRKSARVWKEGREDETCEGGKVIGGLVSSIPGEKRELPPVTVGGKGPEYHNEIKRYIMVILTFDV